MTDTTEEPQITPTEVEPKPAFENGSWIWEKHYPDGVSWKDPVAKKPLYFVLDQAVEKYGDSLAADFLGKTYTYKEIGDTVNRVAKGLQIHGVKKGTKVGLFLPNSPYAIIFYYAILKAGGTVVNFNPLYVERELTHQIEDSETDIMVTLDLKVVYDKMHHMLHATRLKRIIVCPMQSVLPFPKNLLFPIVKSGEIANISKTDGKHIWYKDLLDNDGKFADVDIDPEEDVAVLQYTGGTTGVAKGAMLTHYNIFANTMQTSAWMTNVTPGKDAMAGILPFFHVFAMTAVLNLSIWYGLKIVLQPRFEVDEVLKMIKKHKPAYFPAVPAIYNAIANHPDVENTDFSCIKFCLSGGAPLPKDVKRLFCEKTKTDKIGEGYGLTESSPVATCNPVEGKVKLGTVGLPLPETIIEIVDRDDGETVLQVGERGEVCIRGPQVMKGYYKKEEETKKALRDGRLHTGDVGYLDEEGYLVLVDRIKDLILVRGYNVYPRYVEEAIYLHPSVEECIVAGVPDDERGETVWAWVKPVKGASLTEEDLKGFLEDKISPIERPRKIIIKDEPLPKTTVGKLSRKDLLIQEGIKKA